MKKKVVRIPAYFFITFLIFSLSSCSPKPKLPVAGSARGQDMLTLLPAETSAFLVIDWNRSMNLKFVQKTIEEQAALQPYQKKIEAFSLNLKKDIYFVAVAVVGQMKKPAENLVLLANLEYQRDKLIPSGSEKDSNLKTYNGIPYFPFIEIEESAVVCLAFLDSSNLAIGSEKAVKKIIDVYTGKLPNILSNRNFKPYLKDINQNALTFGFFALPPDFLQPEINKNPSLQLWENVRYISSFSDYRNASYLTEIKIYAQDKDRHQKMAETLVGIKALGLGTTGQLPELGQVLDSLEITSTDRYVKIFINLKEELLEKLKKIMKERAGDFLPKKESAEVSKEKSEKKTI
jgi:hypothetical protein